MIGRTGRGRPSEQQNVASEQQKIPIKRLRNSKSDWTIGRIGRIGRKRRFEALSIVADLAERPASAVA